MAGTSRSLLKLLYPPECLLCRSGTGLVEGLDLCRGCRAELPVQRASCERCAAPLAHCPGAAVTCGSCLAEPPPFERSWALGPYRDGLACLVNMLKFSGRLEAGRLLGCLLGRYLAAHADCRSFELLPVPLHPRRLRHRGFNQSAEIAAWAARRAGLRLLRRTASRVRHTAAQTGLGAAERRRNLRNAFACHERLDNRQIAIVDDVMTTGSTVASLARTLRQAGCPRIEIWCCARATPH